MRKNTIIISISLVICIVVIIILILIGVIPINKVNSDKSATTETSTDASVVVSTIDEMSEDDNTINDTNEDDMSLNNSEVKENEEIEIQEETSDYLEDNGLTVAENKRIDKIIENMTLEEKIYQMFMVRTDYLSKELLGEFPVGGYILFSNDFDGLSKEQVIENIQSYQNNSQIPLLIGVDEEGGTVVRVSSNYNLREQGAFDSPRSIYENGGMEAIKKDTIDKSKLLLSLGINVNLAPVCDYTDNYNAFMYDRSFGVSIEDTSEYVSVVVSSMKNSRIGSVLKHFPGYGDCADTHTGIVYDERPIEQFKEIDFLPFATGINAGADSILVSHNILSVIDSEMPASLSATVHELIREELNFDGVIMTDDLSMGAITQYIEKDQAAVMAIVAGNDLLITDDYCSQGNAIIEALNEGTITEKRIEESVRRILEWKCRLGILN